MTFFSVVILMLTASCGGGDNKGEVGLATKLRSYTDAQKVAYMIKEVSADSVARFVCDAALGKIEGVRIDTLATATLYAYEQLSGDDLNLFSDEIDRYSSALPLADKMKVYAMMGKADPQNMGYQLGLEYLSDIREHRKSAKEIDEEIEAFRKACGDDTETYERFVKGFQTVIKVDGGKDLPAGVLDKYMN